MKKDIKERMERLKELLLEIDRLSKDSNISDEIFYMIEEKIHNEIINSYTIEEIEKVEKEIEEEGK